MAAQPVFQVKKTGGFVTQIKTHALRTDVLLLISQGHTADYRQCEGCFVGNGRKSAIPNVDF